jgi:hypothetical protein
VTGSLAIGSRPPPWMCAGPRSSVASWRMLGASERER